MKKFFISAAVAVATVIAFSCGNNAEQKTHTHEDGSTHADHDTTKPVQQEFVVGDTTIKDTTGKEHTHKAGKKHSH